MRHPLTRGIVVLILGGVIFDPPITHAPSGWAAQPTGPAFYDIGALPGTSFPESFCAGVSPDSLVAVGRCSTTVIGDQPAQWTPATGLTALPNDPLYFSGSARDASLGGAYIAGQRQLQSNLHYRGFRFHNGAYTDLGDLPGGTDNTYPLGISYDGKTVVGLGNYNTGHTGDEGFIWKEGIGIRGIGFAAGYSASQALAVSGDGNVVVGNTADASGNGPGVRWTESGGMIALGDLPGGTKNSNASCVSFDGSVIAGSCLLNNTLEAFRWTEAASMQGLGDLPGGAFYSVATAISDDGSVVAGYSTTGTAVGVGYEAFVWDASHGMRNVKQVLQDDYGLNLTGWTLDRVNGVSADGNTLAGDGYNPQGRFRGWVAVIPEPTSVALATLVLVRTRMRRARSTAWPSSCHRG